MKLRYIVVLWILIIGSFSALAQPKQLKKAEETFNSFNYKEALKIYTKILEKGEGFYYVTNRIGDCYRHLGNSEKAIEWYLKAIEFPDVDYTTYYVLSHELKKNRQYKEADKYIAKYLELSGKDNDGIKNTIDLVHKLKKDSSNFVIHPLSINSRNSDISPSIYLGKLVFSSNRKKVGASQLNDIRDGSSFYKLYESEQVELTKLYKVKPFESKLSSKYNDGPIAFNQNYTAAFVTRNLISKDHKSYLNIFVGIKKKGKWQKKLTAIPLLQLDFSYMHAFLADNDTRLYFVSDMEGGYGGMDIYVSSFNNGLLTPPINLGPSVNSEANEMFPFVDKSGRLFYSSDKPGGLGGMDIFVAIPNKENGFSQSFNIGYPINTSYDDFSLIYYQDQASGYFSSNRPGGKGKDDIYAFEQFEEMDYTMYSGAVLSKRDNSPLKEAIIQVFKGRELLAETSSNDKGEFSFFLKTNQDVSILVKKRYYNTYRSPLKNIATPANNGYKIKISIEEY